MIKHAPLSAAGYMSCLRYLVPTDPVLVTTIGPCSDCGGVARGGGVCHDCLIKSAPAALREPLSAYAVSLENVRRASAIVLAVEKVRRGVADD